MDRVLEGVRQAKRIRLAHFKALARKPLAYFDQPGQDAGALASSVMDKSLQVQTGLGDDLVQLLVRILQFVFGVGAAMYFCWPLALVSFGAVPLLAMVVAVANTAYARATRNSANLLDMATSTPLEAIGAIRTVHAYGREASILDRYREMCKAARAQGLALGRAKAGLEGATAPIMFVMVRLAKPPAFEPVEPTSLGATFAVPHSCALRLPGSVSRPSVWRLPVVWLHAGG